MTAQDLPTGSLFSHYICSDTGERYEGDVLQTYSTTPDGKNFALAAQYNFASTPKNVILDHGLNSLWQFKRVLPIKDERNIVSLGEGGTPEFHMKELGALYHTPNLFMKYEGGNPTGSFKDRGLTVAISLAKQNGVEKCVIPTAGNAGVSMSAYCQAAGIQARVYMPDNTPAPFMQACEDYGAEVVKIKGDIAVCGKEVAELLKSDPDWFAVSTFKEPGRLEGKKTMGYEIAKDRNFVSLPDVILYPTGGGTGLVGIWKAFAEMKEMGWLDKNIKLPKMYAVQVDGCAPVIEAFNAKAKYVTPIANPPELREFGQRVPAAFAGNMILRALYESGGGAVAVPKGVSDAAVEEIRARDNNLFVSPEVGTLLPALKTLRDNGSVSEDDEVLLLATGSGPRYDF